MENFRLTNIENPISELFSLLPQFKSDENSVPSDTPTEVIYSIKEHADNALVAVYYGLELLGKALSVATTESIALKSSEQEDAGYFIQLLGDIVKSCAKVKELADTALEERKVN